MHGSGGRNFGHLHQREHAFLHARAAAGRHADERDSALRGFLEGMSNFFSHHGTHRAAQKREIENNQAPPGGLRSGKIQRSRLRGLRSPGEPPANERDRICGPQIRADRRKQARGPVHGMSLHRQATRFARAKAWTNNDCIPGRCRGSLPARPVREPRRNRDTSPWEGWRFYLSA